MTLTTGQQVELKRNATWLEFDSQPSGQQQNETRQIPQKAPPALGPSEGSASQLLESVKEPMARYLTLATSLTSQLGGGLKSRVARPAQPNQAPQPLQVGASLEAAAREEGDTLGPLASARAAPLAPPPPPPASGVGSEQPKGRPMNRLAMSRAKFAIRSYTIAAAMPRRSRSLVDDAKLDTQRNRQLIDEIRREQELIRASMDFGEESEAPSGGDATNKPSGQAAAAARPGDKLNEAQEEEEEEELEDPAKEAERYLIDFPRHISDLDHCNHLLIKYEPELDPTHPGFHDLEYRHRRKEVAEVAFAYKHGERIPQIQYNDRERATWRQIYVRLREAYKKYACEQHNQAISELERERVYTADDIPQLQQVSEFLERRTGWRLRPVAGLLSARDFLASLAFRVFQTTQYIRHWGNPEHSVEPDCIHELMGHIPMLCDPEFAQFSQELGLASLGAPDEQIERFATLYWFTVEFGLCREAGQLKCYGAGLLSSYGEMEHALESGKPKLKEFVPEETALETYDDSEYQVVYYVANSFNDAKAKMRDYAAQNLGGGSGAKNELVYDPYTCTIKELASYDHLETYANSIRSDLNRLTSALGRLKMAQAAPPIETN